MTTIRVIDEPCGYGKTSNLIRELKTLRDTPEPNDPVIIVVPELSEITRYQDQLGKDWLPEPLVVDGTSKTEALIALLMEKSNVITTHSLYERIKRFENLLVPYHVIVDEVPTAAKQLPVQFGRGLFKNLIHHKQYITIDPATNLIRATSNWLADQQDYESGDDLHIKKFMDAVVSNEVYFVEGIYCVMPIPDAFFTRPKTLTILTFLFEGTQLHHWLLKKGYQFQHFWDPNELAQFKTEMAKHIYLRRTTAPVKAGFNNMNDKDGKLRKQVATWVKNQMKKLRNLDSTVHVGRVLVASHKDAWYGQELNKQAKVSDTTCLKKLSGLSKAQHTTLITRGTNKFKALDIVILLGKENLHPSLAKFLGMATPKAADRHTLTELVQLIYRSAIRDRYPIYLMTPDPDNIRILKEFLTT
jgi:hypothetical protein